MRKLLFVLLLIPSIAVADKSFVKNPAATSAVPGRTGDTTQASVDANGRLFLAPGAGGVAKTEDSAHASGDVGVPGWTVRQDSLSASSSTSDNADYQATKSDIDGRLYVNPWGAGGADWFAVCNSTDIVTNTQTILKVATASTYWNVTSFACTNTGAAATRVELRTDIGTPVVVYAGMLAATTGYFSVDLATPIRTLAANKDVHINVLTTGSATRCCIAGFGSAN